MNKYEIGQVIEEYIGRAEGTLFDIADDGATLIVFFDDPTEKEKEQFKAGSNFEVRFIQLYDTIILTTKIGTLNWMDCPYSSHLSPNLTKLYTQKENEGLALSLILINSKNGKIEHMRLIGLGEKFTKNFLKQSTRKEARSLMSLNIIIRLLKSLVRTQPKI